jgi:hypothetical protein
MAPMQYGVGAGKTRPMARIIKLGGENPPLQCWAYYFFKCHNFVTAWRIFYAGEFS